MSESEMVRFRTIKPEIRVLGIDDSDFVTREKGLVVLIGVVYRGGCWLEGVMQTEIEVDGMDATEKIATMIKASPHYDQLRVIMLDGITFAGFNIVDITELFQKVKLPVIAIVREKPNLEKIRKALENLPDPEKRWAAIEHAGKISRVRTRGADGTVYMQTAGIFQGDAETIVRNTSLRSNVPEALRVAHIIASGLAKSKERFKREDLKGNGALAG
jgi:endonuclease V-like protein UPF0215 family